MGTYRADQVGSFLRPRRALEARRASGDGPRAAARPGGPRTSCASCATQQELGFEIFTDGELRRKNFMSDFTDAVEGVRPRRRGGPHVAGGRPAAARSAA